MEKGLSCCSRAKFRLSLKKGRSRGIIRSSGRLQFFLSFLPGAFLLSFLLIPPSLLSVDFTWSSGEVSLTYRFTPSTGTLADLEVITASGFSFHPCRFGGITSLILGGHRLSPWEGLHAAEFLGDSSDQAGAYIARFRWEHGGEALDFSLRFRLEGRTLVIEAQADPSFQGILTFSTDRSEGTPDPRIIELPFGHPVLFSNGYFISAVLDPFYSRSSWIVPLHEIHPPDSAAFGYGAWYFTRSDGRRSPLQERLFLTVSPWIEDTFYRPPLAISPYRDDLARRVVVDMWLESFRAEEEFLRWLASFSFKDFLVIIHRWQKYGYDNGLPSTFPAGEMYGGGNILSRIAGLCQQQGYRLALHTNYVDFYPNSDVWNPADVALSPRGELVASWFNASTGIQSYLLKPTRALFYAQIYEPLIHETYQTGASFLDVHPAILPSFKVDFDARIEGAGEQLSTFLSYRDLMARVREIHQGPVAGEGMGYSASLWAGYIDSLEADPRSLPAVSQGKSASLTPCLVDYKLRILHERFVPHGMGLWDRFFPPSKVISSEDFQWYRATEIAFGQAGYLQAVPGLTLPPEEILREYCFLKHLQQKYLAASVRDIFYEIQGEFLSLSDALRRLLPASPLSGLDEFLRDELCRLRLSYDNGLVLFINRSLYHPWDIIVDDSFYTLPPGGFLARQGDSFLAYTALVNGVKEFFLWPAEPWCQGSLQDIILAPLQVEGKKMVNRSLFQVEYLVVLTWAPNPANQNIQGYRIYLEEGGVRLKLGEVEANTCRFWHRRVQKDKTYRYAIVAFNHEGREGQVASVEVR